MTTVILVGLIVVLLAAAAYVGVLLVRRSRSAAGEPAVGRFGDGRGARRVRLRVLRSNHVVVRDPARARGLANAGAALGGLALARVRAGYAPGLKLLLLLLRPPI